ncbi:hypothetical protein IMSAGC009_04616 [Lachnospiraceae bacterium]|nr:hypothetical protein IMSAGC009_04616 [Lachnospiraceae bacterium]
MEELAKLEEKRGTPGYAKMGRIVTNGDTQVIGRHGKGSLTGGSGATGSSTAVVVYCKMKDRRRRV